MTTPLEPTPPTIEPVADSEPLELVYTVLAHRVEGVDLIVSVEWATEDAAGERKVVLTDQLRFDLGDSAERIEAGITARARDYVAPRYLPDVRAPNPAAAPALDALVGRTSLVAREDLIRPLDEDEVVVPIELAPIIRGRSS